MECTTCGRCRRMVNDWLAEGTFDERLPEVAALRGVPQPEEFHREGDAFAHTMLALEQVAEEEDVRVFWGVLLHDVGKAMTTRLVDGRWRAFGHDQAGEEPARLAMVRLGLPDIADDVAWLVRHHLFHFSWNLRSGAPLSLRQRRFAQHPLFPLLLKVVAADAAASVGGEHKGDVAALLAEAVE